MKPTDTQGPPQKSSPVANQQLGLFLRRKTTRLLLTLLCVALFAFTLIEMSPIDPVTAYLGMDRMQISEEHIATIVERWGLDQSGPTRFFLWAKNVLQGDFGTSIIYNEPVVDVIAKRFFVSLKLMGLAWLFSGIFGLALGVTAGLRQHSLADKCVRLYAYLMASTPSFWVGIVLLSIFSVWLGWTPVCGAVPIGVCPADATVLQYLQHMLLPAATLSIVGIAQIALHTREKMIEAMTSNYATFAWAQGESRWGIGLRHALINVLLPALTLQFASLGELFGGSVLAEQVFSYPGLGKATVEAGLRGDVPLLLGITLISALFVFSGNLIADMLYLRVDPRIQSERGLHP